MSVGYRLLLVTAHNADQAALRQALQSAALPEPTVLHVHPKQWSPSLPMQAADVLLVDYAALRESCEFLAAYLHGWLPNVPVILLANYAEEAAAQADAERYHSLALNYAALSPPTLRQVVNFAAEQARQHTALRQTQQAFSNSSQLLHNLISHNADGMLVIDQQGMIRFANPAAAALFGRESDALLNLPFGFPLVIGETTELDIPLTNAPNCVVEMRVVATQWENQPAYLATLRDITERSLAQQRLQRRLALESLLASLSAQFVSLPLAQVDSTIHSALAHLARFIGADRALLIDFMVPPSPQSITHLWEADAIAGIYQQTNPEAIFSYYIEQLTQNDTLHIPDVGALPEAHPARAGLIRRGVRSSLVVAMHVNNTLRGCLAFNAVLHQRDWQAEDAALLKIAADVFASTLRRAEINRALRESEARLRFVISNAPLILFTFDTTGTINFIEGSLIEERYPFLREWLGQSALDDIYIAPHLLRTLKGESSTSIINPGDNAALELHLTPLYNDEDVIIGGIGVAIDVTERYYAQEAERQQRRLLETLAEASAALTSSLDMKEVMENILTYAERVVPSDGGSVVLFTADSGYVTAARGQSAHLTNRRWQQLFALPEMAEKIQAFRTAGKVDLIQDTQTSDQWLLIEGTEWIRAYLGLPIEVEGRVVGILHFDSATPNYFTPEHVERLQTLVGYAGIAIQNANLYSTIQQNAKALERHVRERTAELEAERARLNAILDSMDEGVIFFESQDALRAAYANPAFYRMLGCLEPEIIGCTIQELTHKFYYLADNTEAILDKILIALARERYWQGELRLKRTDGNLIETHITVSRAASPQTRSLGTMAIIRDITAEKTLQEQKDRFIANAAHELRTPLTNLKMRLYLLRRQPEATNDHLDVLEQVARRMHALVEDLLDVTRFDRGMLVLDRQNVSLQALLEEVAEVQQPHLDQKHIHMQLDLPETEVMVWADHERLIQVFTNLLVNAINYTESGGTIAFTLYCEADHALISVVDSGLGIPAEMLPHIFDPFFRANLGTQRGTGLGLTISREIVLAHGGEISAQSERGKGTTITVRLPLPKPTATDSQ